MSALFLGTVDVLWEQAIDWSYNQKAGIVRGDLKGCSLMANTGGVQCTSID